MTGVNSGAETANPSGAPELTPSVWGGGARVAQYLVFCVVFFIDNCLFILAFLFWSFVLSVLILATYVLPLVS